VKQKLWLGALLALLAAACDRETSGARIGVYDHPQVALVVMDAQRDFLEDHAEPVLGAVNQLIDRAPRLGVDVVYVRSERGAAVDSRLGKAPHHVFAKGRNDAFSNAEFDAYLRGREIGHLVFAGARADSSIYYTALGAMNRGYKVKVVSDASAATSEAARDGALESLRKRGAEVVTTEQTLTEWARRMKYLGSR
jgi:nicotinamidase-related amidase